MSILTDLRAALEVKREVEAALDLLHKPGTSGFDEVSWKRAYYRLKHLEDDLHRLLTDDTIRALLDVAEAAQEQNERYCSDITDENIDEEVRIALAPLVKEDCPTCHGLGGGGGFDRNGSHTEGQRDNLKCNSLAALENAGTDLLGFISQPSFQITRREAREAVKCMKRTGAALVACIERLEAERDALLAAVTAAYFLLNSDQCTHGDGDWHDPACRVCNLRSALDALPPDVRDQLASMTYTERVIHGE